MKRLVVLLMLGGLCGCANHSQEKGWEYYKRGRATNQVQFETPLMLDFERSWRH